MVRGRRGEGRSTLNFTGNNLKRRENPITHTSDAGRRKAVFLFSSENWGVVTLKTNKLVLKLNLPFLFNTPFL